MRTRIAAGLLFGLIALLPGTLAAQGDLGPIDFGPISASGTTPTSGQFDGTVERAGVQEPISGTYDGVIAFSGTVSGTVIDILTESGSFITSGTFDADVSTTGLGGVTPSGTWSGSGTFSAGTYTVGGTFTVTSPVSGSGSFNAGGTYDAVSGAATISGSYTGTVTIPAATVTVSATFSGQATVAIPAGLHGAQLGLIPAGLIETVQRLGTLAAVGPAVGSVAAVSDAATPDDDTPADDAPVESVPVALSEGWNLVAWLGADGMAIDDAVAELSDALVTLFIWDASAQRFLGWSLSLPPSLRTATVFPLATGVWILVSRDAIWNQPLAGG